MLLISIVDIILYINNRGCTISVVAQRVDAPQRVGLASERVCLWFRMRLAMGVPYPNKHGCAIRRCFGTIHSSVVVGCVSSAMPTDEPWFLAMATTNHEQPRRQTSSFSQYYEQVDSMLETYDFNAGGNNYRTGSFAFGQADQEEGCTLDVYRHNVYAATCVNDDDDFAYCLEQMPWLYSCDSTRVLYSKFRCYRRHPMGPSSMPSTRTRLIVVGLDWILIISRAI